MRKSQLSWEKLYKLAMSFATEKFSKEHKAMKTKFDKGIAQKYSDYDTHLLMEFLEFATKNHK